MVHSDFPVLTFPGGTQVACVGDERILDLGRRGYQHVLPASALCSNKHLNLPQARQAHTAW